MHLSQHHLLMQVMHLRLLHAHLTLLHLMADRTVRPFAQWQDCVHMVAEGHNSCVVIGLTYHLLGVLDWASRNSTVSLVKCTYKVVVRLRVYWVIIRTRLPREQVFEHKVAPCIIVLVKTGFTFCLHGMHRKQWSVLHSIKHMKHSNMLWWWQG